MLTNKRVGFRVDMESSSSFSNSYMDPMRAKDSEDKDINDIIGQCGPWQLRTFVIFLFISFSCSWHNLILAFQSPNVQHWCRQSHNVSNWMTSKYYQCHDGEHRCKSWIYDDTMYQNTIVDEWDLVCDRKWLTSFAKSVYMFGHLVASLVFGQLSDRIGRRPVILLCYFLFWWCALATVFANSIGTFLFLRFLVALGQTAAYTTTFVTMMEVMGSEVRPVYGIACKFGSTFGYMTLPAVAWFIRDWRSLQVAITLPWVAMIAMWWILEESPRWLLISDQAEKAEVLLLGACRRNGKTLEEVQVPLLKLCSRSLKDKGASSKKDGISDLLQYPNLRRSTFYQFFIWFSTSLVYYALTWGTNELDGDPYWNFFLSGLIEVPATTVSMFVAKYYGRRKPLSYASFVAGGILTFYSCMVAREDMRAKLFWFMLAKFCTVISFTLLYVYSSELFPTTVRGLGVGYCSTAARLGGILAPFASHMGGSSQPHLCYWTYGLLSVSSGLCILLLPETNNRKLPDTLMDGESFHRNDVIISCRSLSNS